MCLEKRGGAGIEHVSRRCSRLAASSPHTYFFISHPGIFNLKKWGRRRRTKKGRCFEVPGRRREQNGIALWWWWVAVWWWGQNLALPHLASFWEEELISPATYTLIGSSHNHHPLFISELEGSYGKLHHSIGGKIFCYSKPLKKMLV